MEISEVVDVLQELLEEIKEKVEYAFELVAQVSPEDVTARAKAYWYAQILTTLDEDSQWLGGSMCTLQDTINELSELDEDEDSLYAEIIQ